MRSLLQKYREARGLSQEELADRAGVHQSTVGRFEKRDLFPKNLRKLCEALGIRPIDLVPPEDNPHRLRNEREAALLDIFRRMNPETQATLLSRAMLSLRAQEGTLTEAEWIEPDLPDPLAPDVQRQPKTGNKPRKRPASAEPVE